MTDRMTVAEYNALNKPQRKTRETRSKDKETLGQWLLYSGLPWITEYKFHQKRRWLFDWALVDLKVSVEYEGGIFQDGKSHSNAMDYTADCEKYAEAAIAGWLVIRCTAPMVRSGLAFDLIQRAIEARK